MTTIRRRALALVPFLAASLCLAVSVAPAQQSHYYDIWYFGYLAGLDFRSGSPVPVSGSLYTNEGSASICNPRTGDLLFYTEGVSIWNREHKVMKNGLGLMGHYSSTQSALIVPKPGSPHLFYVFTAEPGPYINASSDGGIRYSMVDMEGDSGRGEVVEKNHLLLDQALEKLVGVRHCDYMSYWVIGHEALTDRFFAWKVSVDGISPPVISSAGQTNPASNYASYIGSLKASPDGTHLFSIITSEKSGELLRFNPSTGVVGPVIAELPAEYGSSFSPNSRFLYVPAILNSGGVLTQYDLEAPGGVERSGVAIDTFSVGTSATVASVQIGPDGKIHLFYSTYWGIVNNPDRPGAKSNYTEHSGVHEAASSGPNCIDGFFATRPLEPCIECTDADFTQSDIHICIGETVSFRDQSPGNPTSWFWLFEGGEPGSSIRQHPPSIRYDSAGEFLVRLIVSDDTEACLDSAKVIVHALPETDAGADQLICPGDTIRLQGKGAQTFHWSPSESLSCEDCPDPRAFPETTTTYYLRGEDEFGCRSIDSLVVEVLPEHISVSSDTSICDGTSVMLYAEGRTDFRWTPSKGLSCDNCPNPVASPEETTTYIVEGSLDGGCISIDSVVVYVGTPPTVEAGEDRLLCIGDSVQLDGSGQGSREWTPSSSLSCRDCPRPFAFPTTSTTYYLTVTNESGCTGTDSVRVEVVGGEMRANPDTTICPGEQVQLHASGRQNYQWTPRTGLSCDTCADPIASPAVTTHYIVEGSTGECVSYDTVVVTVHDIVADAGTDTTICLGDSLQFRGSGGTDYLWIPADGMSGEDMSCRNCPDPIVRPIRTRTYLLRVTDSTGCIAWDSITIYVTNAGTLTARGDTSFCPGGTAYLSVEGAATYQWSSSITPAMLSCSDCPNPIATPEVSTTYYVIGTNADGECPSLDSVTVTVHPLPIADAGEDTTLCPGQTVRLLASGGVRYQWDSTAGLSCLDCPDPLAVPVTATTYRVTVYNDQGCAARDSVRVDLHPPLLVSAGEDQKICRGDSVILHAEGGVRLQWLPEEWLSCTDCPSPQAFPEETTTYHVIAWNAEGCEARDSVTVVVREESEILRLRIGRKYQGYTGESLIIPVELLDPPGTADITELELELNYDPHIMIVDPGSIERLLDGTLLEGWEVEREQHENGTLVVRLRAPVGTTLTGAGNLLKFEGRLYLSRVAGTLLSFEVRTPNRCVTFVEEAGYAELDSICGLNFRMIEANAEKYVPPIAYPNPATERVTVEFGLGLDGPVRLEVFDMGGERIGLLLDEWLGPGRYSVEWDVRNIPSGTYWYRLACGNWSGTGQINITQ